MTSRVKEVQFEKSVLWDSLLTPAGRPLAGSIAAAPVAIGVMLIVGGRNGLLNGLSVSRLRMPAFMVTLVTSTFFASVAIWMTRSYNIGALPDEFLLVGKGTFFVVPFAMIVALLTAIVVHTLLSRMVDGRWLYATGTNETAARVSGVPTKRAITPAFVISGVCAAISSVLFSARLEAGMPTLGSGTFMLEVIAATVIGGTSLFGGSGKVIWAFFGVFFFSHSLATASASWASLPSSSTRCAGPSSSSSSCWRSSARASDDDHEDRDPMTTMPDPGEAPAGATGPTVSPGAPPDSPDPILVFEGLEDLLWHRRPS